MHERVAAVLADVLRRLDMVRNHFGVVTVHLPDAWVPELKTTTFDAHDTLKALGATARIPPKCSTTGCVRGRRAFVARRVGDVRPTQAMWRRRLTL